MGHRLSKIYTRTGDAGTTGLGDGQRVAKHSLRIQTLGDIDETNALVGLILCEELPSLCWPASNAVIAVDQVRRLAVSGT